MEEYEQKMMEYAFATQVLILAGQMRMEARSRGEEVKRDMIPEAIRLIKRKSPRIFEHLDILA